MTIKELPYYAKFIFSCNENGFCISTSDIEVIKSIQYSNSKKSIDSFRIGDEIIFYEIASIFKISNIRIGHLFDDFDDFKFGIDMSDCTNYTGKLRQQLFKINIELIQIA